MADDDAGKRAGVLGAGAAGLLALFAKFEHCAAGGAKALAPTAILAEEGARVGARALPALGEEAALGARALPHLASDGAVVAGMGAKNLRPGSLVGLAADGASAGAHPFVARSFRGVGLRTGAVRVGFGPARGVAAETTALDHFLPTGLDLAGSSLDIASLVTDDAAGAGAGARDGVPFVPVLRGGDGSMVIALEPVPDPPATARSTLRIRSAQIRGTRGLLALLPIFAHSSPLVFVGRSEGAGVRIPGDQPASPEALLAAAASLGEGGAIVVCPAHTTPGGEPDFTCEIAVEAVQAQAGERLRTLPSALPRPARLNAFSRWLVEGVVAAEATRESEVSFLSFDDEGHAALVRRSPAAAASAVSSLASAAPSASAKRAQAPLPTKQP
jgi:hypothetical protein